MAKAKKATQTLFIAFGISEWNNSGFEVAVGKTKKDASNQFYDNEGRAVTDFFEIEVPSADRTLSKIPTTIIKVAK